ncbi:MAG: YdcF family protein, partial [Candidatus Uhrbacteria bacterium]|nr:YdcF family protein [Candidatus Uhrbacteria bacterium]
MITILKRILLGVVGAVTATGVLIVSAIGYVQFIEAGSVVERREDVRPVEYAIVLGASVKQDGTPSDALEDRVMEGVDAYKEGKVQKLLMTGDDGAFHINEVETMARVAREAGVPADDIVVDGQGYRTYESCKRAAEKYEITEAVVVTQRFHLSRALFLCSAFGIDVQGLPADRRTYQRIGFFFGRDLLASFKAFWDVYVWPP